MTVSVAISSPGQDNNIAFPTSPEDYLVLPIVILLLRTCKPMRIDFLSIFEGSSRGPRKMVFRLKIMHSKSAGSHGVLWAKSTNFQGLVFIPKTEKLLLWP